MERGGGHREWGRSDAVSAGRWSRASLGQAMKKAVPVGMARRPAAVQRSRKGQDNMANEPVDLDRRRGFEARIATEIRRQRLRAFLAEQAELHQNWEELEAHFLARPANTWPEAAAKALYLLQLYHATPEARDPRRRQLIDRTLDDLSRLCERAMEDL